LADVSEHCVGSIFKGWSGYGVYEEAGYIYPARVVNWKWPDQKEPKKNQKYPKRTHSIFKSRRKFEIYKIKICGSN
jgi:hypothetical protein